LSDENEGAAQQHRPLKGVDYFYYFCGAAAAAAGGFVILINSGSR
jgi:hypothetical protein